MDLKKILATGIPAGFVIFVIGNIMYYAFQGIYMAVPAEFYKPMPMPGWIIQLLLVNLFAGVLIAAAYDKLHNFMKLQKERETGRGLKFGLWMGTIFGLIWFTTSYIIVNMSLAMQLIDLVNTVIGFTLAGGVIGWIYAKM